MRGDRADLGAGEMDAKGSKPGAQSSWPLSLRIAFRFLAAYLIQFALGSNHKTVLEKVPLLGRSLQAALNWPYLRASQWIAVHLLHLTGPAVVPHASGFGDRTLDWITAALMLLLAALATIVWSLLDRRRTAYPAAWLWLRFLLRLTLIVAMLWYGSIKLWPIQIESPSLAVLNEPVGNLSPMTLLWTLLGSNHTYERVCGLVETVCGLLLLWRRTALSGALLAVVIMSNVLLFDLFFDVPVRLYAAHLLLMSIVVLAPDLPPFFSLLWGRRPAALSSTWVPATRSRAGAYAVLAVESIFLLVFLKGFVNHAQYTREAAFERHPPVLSGQWHLDPAAAAFPTPAGSPLTDLFLEPSGRDTVRAADGTLHGGGTYDPDRGSLTLASSLMTLVPFRIEQPDADHLLLHPLRAADPELRFTRVPLPSHYPLYERRFVLFNEFGYER